VKKSVNWAAGERHEEERGKKESMPQLLQLMMYKMGNFSTEI